MPLAIIGMRMTSIKYLTMVFLPKLSFWNCIKSNSRKSRKSYWWNRPYRSSGQLLLLLLRACRGCHNGILIQTLSRDPLKQCLLKSSFKGTFLDNLPIAHHALPHCKHAVHLSLNSEMVIVKRCTPLGSIMHTPQTFR